MLNHISFSNEFHIFRQQMRTQTPALFTLLMLVFTAWWWCYP